MNNYILQLNDEDGIRHIALLSQSPMDLKELRVNIWGNVCFERITKEDKPRLFALSFAEADAFVEAYQAYKQALSDKEQAEAHRLELAREEAFEIAENCPEVSIVPDTSDVWVVTLGKAKYSDHDYDERSYGPDELLQNVQSAKKDWDREQQVKADVEKAHKVVALIEEASIDAEGNHYWITFYGKRRWSEPDDLYATLCEMANEYISDLLNAHPYIELEKISKKTAEQKAVWAIRHNGQERTAQGLNEVLTAIGECIEAEKVA